MGPAQARSETPKDREIEGSPYEREIVSEVLHQVNWRVQERRKGMIRRSIPRRRSTSIEGESRVLARGPNKIEGEV